MADFPLLLGCRKNRWRHARAEYRLGWLAHEHGSAIYVEDLAGDEAGVLGTQEQDRGRNFFRLAHAPHGNGAANLFAAARVVQRGFGTLCRAIRAGMPGGEPMPRVIA